MRRDALVLVVAALVGGSLLACSSTDGRSLPPPRVAQTTTTPSSPVIQPSAGNVEVFVLTSQAFEDGGEIPERFTCEGAGTSPSLAWSGTPLDAASLALVVRDLSAGGFVHWVVLDIDPFVQGVGEGGLPENAIEGHNGTGGVGWTGPCPPAGSGVHTYEFALLALVDRVDLPLDTPAEEAAAALEAAAIERAVLTGTVAAG
jgi:Raf kinase inhibitor-like YbhB/YbcL family protein